jgi:hypothetical protein
VYSYKDFFIKESSEPWCSAAGTSPHRL